MRLSAAAASLSLLGLMLSSCAGPEPTPPWHEEGGHRWRELVVPTRGAPGFTALGPSQTRIGFANQLLEERSLDNGYLLGGSGVALGDVDGDGRVDVYLSRLSGSNMLYRNLGGWRFEDITSSAGVDAPDRFSTGAVLADVDGDGDVDLLTAAFGGPNALFLNDGSGKFREATEQAGLASALASTTMTLADVDGDQDLDLYVANYKVEAAEDVFGLYERPSWNLLEETGDEVRINPEFGEHFRFEDRDGRRIATEQAEPDRLYLNDGSGRFEPVSWTSGRFLDPEGRPLLRDADDFALTARFYDVDGDGDPDLYVCNDFDDPDHLWMNDGTGTFQAAARLALRTTSNASMAVDFADIDRDGDVDFFVTDMLSRDRRRRQNQRPAHIVFPKAVGQIDDRPQFQRNTAFMNRRDGTFAQIAEFAGLEASDWSWGTLFLDVDLDGYEDLLIANGNGRNEANADVLERVASLRGSMSRIEAEKLFSRLEIPNVAFRNRGDFTFDEVGAAWGFAVEADVSHGIAAGDLDGDGDLDVIVNRLGRPVAVLRNDATNPRLAVRLRGVSANTQGVGAKVRLTGGALPDQEKEVTLGGLYLSSSDPMVAFAATDEEGLRLVVEWRSGRRSVVEGVRPNRLYEVDEASAGPSNADEAAGATPPAQPYFEDVSALLDHTHVENDFDDFRRQPLLPNGLSRLGPGVTWGDLDADGDPDLLIPSGRGGRLAYLRNEGGTFRAFGVGARPAPYDQTTALPFLDSGGDLGLLIGQAAYEADAGEASEVASLLVATLDAGPGATSALSPGATRGVPASPASVGPLALADYDGDGDLDLFVGARVLPAGYPLAPTSRLFLREGDGFRLDEANESALAEAGLVSGAVFSDIDGDGDPDLLLAVEWGPVRLLMNEAGRFQDAPEAYWPGGLTSRWNGVTTGDLDGDGRLDVIATSWGRNTELRPAPDRPLLLFHDDFDRNGQWDLFLSQAVNGSVFPLDRYDRVRSAIPSVRSRLSDFESYANATLGDVLGVGLSRVRKLEVRTLDHTLFLNRGDSFQATPLPPEAQFAPASHVGVADFDGDGKEDVFLSQNYFPTALGTPRHDAGRALWLRGDGSGSLQAVPGAVSGIEVYGDQRGAALADYDLDGRIDLAISQNGAATKLYRNQGADPGLSVRLVGSAKNPRAIGALVRVVYDEDRGPVRELHAGSGYWSMDDPIPVMGLSAEPTGVWVRWPDGHETISTVEPGARQIVIRRR